ncbi:MAG: ankyrin repeat domain-containing protein [Nannocystaceae bacterium]
MITTRRELLAHATAGLSLSLLGCRAPQAPAPPPGPSLLEAAARGDVAAVERALRVAPAQRDARDDRGRSALTLALLGGHAAVVELLRARGQAPDVAESAWLGDWERFDTLAAADPDSVNADHPIGGSAMYAAARGGQGSELWRVFAQCGVPNPARDPQAPSPLRAAFDVASLADAEMSAATLLANGADPNAREPGGQSSLHAAAARGSVELVEMLVRKRARVDARDLRGHTPLDVATDAGHTRVAALLRGHAAVARDHVALRRAFTADGAAYDPPSLADLSAAEQRSFVGLGHAQFEELRARLDGEPRLVHATATTTELAVEAASHTGRDDIARYLLDRGAPLSMPTAVLLGDTRLVAALLDAAPDRIHERGPHDFALLWYPAIGDGSIDMTELLIQRGAEVEAQHYLGTTALHFAAKAGHRELVARLLERGARPDRVGRKFDAAGQTPLQLATARGHADVVALLRERGGA